MSVSEDGRARDLVAGSRIWLEFRRGGELQAAAGCNLMSGPSHLSHGRLVLAGLCVTEMACAPALMEQESWLAEFLSSEPSLRLEGATLTLTSAGTAIELLDRQVADPDRPLQETRWTVTTLIGGQTASSVLGGGNAHMTFGADGTMTGNTGCNSFSAQFTVYDNTITISGLTTTRMACEPGREQLEQAVLGVLSGGLRFEIDADHLTLTGNQEALHLRAG